MIDNIQQFIAAMPKVELHVHLEGSIRTETLQKLAKRHPDISRKIPIIDICDLRSWFTFKDFAQFGEIFITIQNLLREPEDFELIAYEYGREMFVQNILYSEVILAPFTHTHLLEKGLKLSDILYGLEEGRRKAQLDFGVEIRWVFGFDRGLCVNKEKKYNFKPAETTLAYAIEAKSRGVVGLTVGGNELSCPPDLFGSLFRSAKQEGLLSLPHAGENSLKNNSTYVRAAVFEMFADRIGHGIAAIKDSTVLALLRERSIPLDINLTSNLALQIYSDLSQHPFVRLEEAGLILTVNTDDPALFNTSLNREFELLKEIFEYTRRDITRVARNSFMVCGANPDLKEIILSKFDEWEGSIKDD